jgi:hypothetical protein
MKKIQLGDIFEIETSKGKAYLHYIYKDSTIGALIRVLPGLYAFPPDNLDILANSKELYMIFFPLSAANNRKIVKLVGHYPENNFPKPRFMRIEHDSDGWDIVNTDTWQRELVRNLSSEQKELSPWGVWNDTLLVERLVGNWSLKNWA